MPETMRMTFVGDEGISLIADTVGAPSNGSVIFAHGGGQTRHAWAKAGERVAADGWRAVMVDLRGHGESDWAPSGDYRLQKFAADLIAVAGTLGGRPHLVGASLGGLAGMMAEAYLREGTFASLTLVDITPHMEPAGVAKVMGFMSDKLEEGFATVEEAADVIASYMPHRPRPADLSGLAKNLRQSADGRYRWHWDPRFVTSVMQTRDRHSMEDMQARLGELRLPIHLIRGRMSELVTEENAKLFLNSTPNASYTDIAGAGHMVAGDRNDAFVDAVVAFLSAQ
ncbi:MAG: alpha/beta hydrolase [Hyphomonadaceae bacterium]|nr:alpha/beta hydrolase [Hyphomonadaceae bacterium]